MRRGNGNLTAKTPRHQEEKAEFLFHLRVLASWRFSFVLVFFLALCAGRVIADDSVAVPFYYAEGTGLEAPVSTLVVGANGSIGQAVRSGDRKYVSLSIDANLLESARIQQFQYQKRGLGFVGSGAATGNMPRSAGNGMTPTIAGSASEIAPASSILDQVGMVLVTPLER
jgi:hypothetical protein